MSDDDDGAPPFETCENSNFFQTWQLKTCGPRPYLFYYLSSVNICIVIMLVADCIYHFYAKSHTKMSSHRGISLRKTNPNAANLFSVRYVYSQEQMLVNVPTTPVRSNLPLSTTGKPVATGVNGIAGALPIPQGMRLQTESHALKDLTPMPAGPPPRVANKPITEENWFPEFRRKNFLLSKYAPINLSPSKLFKLQKHGEAIKSKLAEQVARRNKNKGRPKTGEAADPVGAGRTKRLPSQANIFATVASLSSRSRVDSMMSEDRIEDDPIFSQTAPTTSYYPTSSSSSNPSRPLTVHSPPAVETLLPRRVGHSSLPPVVGYAPSTTKARLM